MRLYEGENHSCSYSFPFSRIIRSRRDLGSCGATKKLERRHPYGKQLPQVCAYFRVSNNNIYSIVSTVITGKRYNILVVTCLSTSEVSLLSALTMFACFLNANNSRGCVCLECTVDAVLECDKSKHTVAK